MYSRLADENASTNGLAAGTSPTATNATMAPAMPDSPETTFNMSARLRL